MPSRDFGTQGRALLRVAGRKTGENRWVRAFYRPAASPLRSIGRVLHVLWLEVTGLLFLLLAVVGGGSGGARSIIAITPAPQEQERSRWQPRSPWSLPISA